MAATVMDSHARSKRHRSSTMGGSAAPLTDMDVVMNSIISRLAGLAALDHSMPLDRVHDDLGVLAGIFLQSSEIEPLQDSFRRAHGLQTLVAILRGANLSAHVSTEQTALLPKVFTAVLDILLKALKNHEGNRRYFAKRVEGGGWEALRDNLLGVQAYILSCVSNEIAFDETCSVLGSLWALAFGNEGLVNLFNPYSLRSSTHDTSTLPSEMMATDNELGSSKFQSDRQKSYLQGVFPSHDHMSNPETAPIMVSLYINIQSSVHTDQSWSALSLSILHSVQICAESSFRNMVALHETGVSSMLLARLLGSKVSGQEADVLEHICGTFLTLGIAKIDDAALLFREAVQSDTARHLLLDALKKTRQPATLQIDLTQGGYSSIELPSIPRVFPPPLGYTLTAWLRIDEFDSETHTTIFGAFDSTQTCFVLVYLEKDSHQLILQTSVTSSRPSVRFKATHFHQGMWYHIAIVHHAQSSSSPRGAALFVNGQFVEQKKDCQYPHLPPPAQGISSAAPFPPDTSRRSPVQAFFGTPQDLASHLDERPVNSRWSLANAHLYETCLSDDLIRVHYKLGACYSGNYQDYVGQLLTYRASAELNLFNEALHPEKGERSEIIAATQQRGSELLPEHKSLISFSASAVATTDGLAGHSRSFQSTLPSKAAQNLNSLTRNGNTVLFNAVRPAISEALMKQHGVAVLTGNPVAFIPQPLDDASWRMTGSLAANLRLLESASSPEAVLDSVNILLLCVRDNWRTSEAMEKENGFGVLALLLREKLGYSNVPLATGSGRSVAVTTDAKERDDLTLELLQTILSFVGYDHDKPEESILINPMAYRALLIDLELWRLGNIDSQKLYYQQLVLFVDGNKHRGFNAKRLSKMREYDVESEANHCAF